MMHFAVLLLPILCLASASDVIDYDGDSFDAGVGEHDIVLVEFYAPWCGHCKKLAPEYEIAATKLKANDPPIHIAKVDCVAEESKALCSRFSVSGFPTLKVFRGVDNVEDYNGPREAAGIVSYMKARSGPSSKDLTSVEEFEKMKSTSKDIMVIGLFSAADSAFAKEFGKASNALRENFKFASTVNADVIKAAGGQADNLLIVRPLHLHSKLEDNEIVMGEVAATSSSMQTFIKNNFAGLAGHYNADSEQFFKKPVAVAYYVVDYEKNIKGTNYWRNRVAKVAKLFADKKISFAVAAKADYEGVLGEMDLNAQSEEVNVVIWDEAGQKYKLTEDFNMQSLEKFAEEFLNGKLEPYLKSEDLPADNDGPVKTVVAKNFEAIVNDEEKDVLIEFYAPWCGHCKKLEPIFVELGEALALEDSVTIAKMDATANDVPAPYEVKGFPTLFWVPKGSKSRPKKYEGGREVKDFLAYIKKEATNKSLKFKDEL